MKSKQGLSLTDGVPVALDGGIRVLQLDKLMAHESPRRQVVGIEFEGALEVGHGFLMLGAQRIIVPNDTARLGPVFVNLDCLVR